MDTLSIAIFGNTNNYPYLLAEGFRSLGHNVRLILNSKELLHRPESINPEWKGAYPDWISDCSDVSEFDIAYESHNTEELVSLLTNGIDIAILNDIGPAFAMHLRCPHVSLLTGSDLTYFGDFGSIEKRFDGSDWEYRRSFYARRLARKLTDLVGRQRDGILSSSVVCYAAKGLIPTGDSLLHSIGVTDQQRMMIYMSHNKRSQDQYPMPNNANLKIFCGTRVTWQQNIRKTYSEIDLKGTDILINGFAKYCSRGGMGLLHLPRKGSDVDNAVRLIAELGIESSVVWYDNMSLEKFEQELISADIVCDQFGASFPGMVTTNAYALGRPVMANFRRDLMPFELPGLNAENVHAVSRQLLAAERNRPKLAELGRESRIFAEAELSPAVMAQRLLERVMS